MSIYRNHNFMILLSGQLVSRFGNYLYAIALPWYVFELTNSKTDLALTGIAQTVPLMAGLFVGVLVDRWNKKHTMIISDLLRGAIAITLFFLALKGMSSRSNLAAMFMLVALMQLVGTVFTPAQSALLPKLVDPKDLTKAIGVNQSSGSVAGLVGLFGGGTLLAVLGAPLLFLFNGISFFVSSLSLLLIRSTEERISKHAKTSLWQDWREGFIAIFELNGMLRVCLLALIANFSLAAFDIVMVAWVKGPMKGNGFVLGTLNGAFMIGSLVGGLLLSRIVKRVQMRHVLLYGCILLGFVDGSIALFASVYWNLPLMFIGGLTIGIINGTIGTSAVRLIPEGMRGRIFSVLGALSTLSQPLGIAVFGTIMLHVALSAVFVLIAAFVIIGGLLFIKPVALNEADGRSA
ncbi:MFS transporter [Alicyclobacillus sp. ALC3]|uniref:MFS transporter n=1 Tax=Alicyclobacillus sp. ALC3 TaxID=2796143 RepID=UPI002379BFDD|nr:MFS transporter [Alicyclobacillus sp. ALC3]WDL95895.1 MFS transporter [Alicyclobacillus sp. ALC3]